jgi:hypothetical protein
LRAEHWEQLQGSDRSCLRECGARGCHRSRGWPSGGCIPGYDPSFPCRLRSSAALRQCLPTVHVCQGEPDSSPGAGIQSSFGSLCEPTAAAPATYLYYKTCECTSSARRPPSTSAAAVAATNGPERAAAVYLWQGDLYFQFVKFSVTASQHCPATFQDTDIETAHLIGALLDLIRVPACSKIFDSCSGDGSFC